MGARSDLDQLRTALLADPSRVVEARFDKRGRLRGLSLAGRPSAPVFAPSRPAEPTPVRPPVDILTAPSLSLDPNEVDDRFASSGMRPDRRRA